MVGPREEVEGTFGLFGGPPPWVFAESWQQAYEIVFDLLKDPAAVRKRQLRVLLWWRSEFVRMRNVVGRTMQGYNYSRKQLLPHRLFG